MGCIGMSGPKGYGFSTVLVSNRVRFFHSSLELGRCVRRSHFLIIIDKTIIESPSQILFRATVPVAMVINRVLNFWSGHCCAASEQ